MARVGADAALGTMLERRVGKETRSVGKESVGKKKLKAEFISVSPNSDAKSEKPSRSRGGNGEGNGKHEKQLRMKAAPTNVGHTMENRTDEGI
jgi:hypothetical protein